MCERIVCAQCTAFYGIDVPSLKRSVGNSHASVAPVQASTGIYRQVRSYPGVGMMLLWGPSAIVPSPSLVGPGQRRVDVLHLELDPKYILAPCAQERFDTLRMACLRFSTCWSNPACWWRFRTLWGAAVFDQLLPTMRRRTQGMDVWACTMGVYLK